MFTLEELESKDIIEVSYESMKKAFENFRNVKSDNKGLLQLDINFFIVEGVQKCIDKDNSILYIYFKIDEKKICKLELYYKDKSHFIIIGENKFNLITQENWGYKYNDGLKRQMGINKMREHIQYYNSMFLAIFQYLTVVLDNRKTIIKEVKMDNKVSKQENIKNDNSKKVNNIIKKKVINLSNDNIKYKLTINNEIANNLIKRTYTRRTETWQVRGYERHYKSGKVTYVKPFIKGNKNGKIENKVYKI